MHNHGVTVRVGRLGDVLSTALGGYTVNRRTNISDTMTLIWQINISDGVSSTLDILENGRLSHFKKNRTQKRADTKPYCQGSYHQNREHPLRERIFHYLRLS